jgi:tyrosyl-tRNA synthetase
LPEDVPGVEVVAEEGGVTIVQALKQAQLTASTSEAIRMIEQGGVRLDGERVSDRGLKLARGTVAVAQVGKRKFARITVV